MLLKSLLVRYFSKNYKMYILRWLIYCGSKRLWKGTFGKLLTQNMGMNGYGHSLCFLTLQNMLVLVLDLVTRWRVVTPCDSPTMMCKAEVTGSLVPTVAKQMQSVEPATKKHVDVSTVNNKDRPTQNKLWSFRHQRITGDIFFPLFFLISRSHVYVSDLQEWSQCEGSRETEFLPDSLDLHRHLSESSRRARGWSHWTCHPLRHTPPWAKSQNHESAGGWNLCVYNRGREVDLCHRNLF